MGWSTNAHCENLVPGPSLSAQGTPKFQATYTVTANGSTDNQPITPGQQAVQGPLGVGGYRELIVDVFLSAITGTSIQFAIDRLGTDGRWRQLAIGTALTAISTGSPGNGQAVTTGESNFYLGAGVTGTGGIPLPFGEGLRIRWITVALTTATFTLSVWGK